MILSETEIRFENAGTVLKTGLSAISNGDTVIDMKNVRRADSSAVAVVLDWIRSAQKSGQPLHVINGRAHLTSSSGCTVLAVSFGLTKK